MRKFKSKKQNNYLDLMLIIICLLTLLIIHYFNININNKAINIAESKIEEISTLYIKKDIIPNNKDLNKIVKIIKNNKDEIIYIDINYDYSYLILKEVIGNIQNNIDKLKQGNIEDYTNSKELKVHNNILYLSIPIFLSDNILLTNLGPKIAIPISFNEYVLGNIETSIKEYGINNVKLNVFMEVELVSKFNIPYKEKKLKQLYKLNLGSKIINGKIPDAYGGLITKNSNILK